MLNCITINGRLVDDPELRTTSNGTSVARFRVAVDRNFASADGKREADFIPVVAWKQSADFVSKYFRKGGMIAVRGRLTSRQYEDKTGVKRIAYEVNAEEINFCGSSQGERPAEKVNEEPVQAVLDLPENRSYIDNFPY